MLGTLHPRHPRGQIPLVLPEVQMPPHLRLGVMHPAPITPALRTREPRALRKVDPQIKTLMPSVELVLHHLPRRLKTKRPLKQLHIRHAGLQSSVNGARHAPSRIGRPTQNDEEPAFPGAAMTPSGRFPRRPRSCCVEDIGAAVPVDHPAGLPAVGQPRPHGQDSSRARGLRASRGQSSSLELLVRASA